MKKLIWVVAILVLAGCEDTTAPAPELSAELQVDGLRVSLVVEATGVDGVRWQTLAFLDNFQRTEESQGRTNGSATVLLDVFDDNDCPVIYRWVVNGGGLADSGERQVC